MERAPGCLALLLLLGAAGLGCDRPAQGAPLRSAHAAELPPASRPPPSKIAPFRANVIALANDNAMYRRVAFTGARSQLALMSIPPAGDIGPEQHDHVEQILVCVSGHGRAMVAGTALTRPRRHAGDHARRPPQHRERRHHRAQALHLLRAPNHLSGRVQATKADAEADHADEAFGEKVR